MRLGAFGAVGAAPEACWRVVAVARRVAADAPHACAPTAAHFAENIDWALILARRASELLWAHADTAGYNAVILTRVRPAVRALQIARQAAPSLITCAIAKGFMAHAVIRTRRFTWALCATWASSAIGAHFAVRWVPSFGAQACAVAREAVEALDCGR